MDKYANRPDAPFINQRERFGNPIRTRETKIDPIISKIVGKPIAVNDPRLIRLVLQWKQFNTNSESFDNHLQDPKKRDELKRIFQ